MQLSSQWRAWYSASGVRSGVAILVLGGLAGVLIGRVPMPRWGPMSIPENFPVAPVLTVILGTGLAYLMLCDVDLRLVRLAPRKRSLQAWRILLLILAAVLAAGVSLLVGGPASFGPQVFWSDCLLFGGLGLATLLLGRPDLCWLPGALWVLVALVFGYSGSGQRWQWWAFPLAGEPSSSATVISLFVWFGMGILLVTVEGRVTR